MATKMNETEIASALTAVPEWSESSGQIQRTFQFQTFVQSLRFVNQVAQAAEDAEHHPDILIRYNKVTLSLSTHDAGGITEKDFALASRADSIYTQLGGDAKDRH